MILCCAGLCLLDGVETMVVLLQGELLPIESKIS